jgi:ABC-type phosphate transport system substrate-binding protein
MNRQTDRNQLTAVLRNMTVALAAVFVVAASAGVAAQTGNPSPATKTTASATSDVPESITLKVNGTSYVYNLSDSGKSYAAEQTSPRMRHHKKQFRCHWDAGGLTCD